LAADEAAFFGWRIFSFSYTNRAEHLLNREQKLTKYGGGRKNTNKTRNKRDASGSIGKKNSPTEKCSFVLGNPPLWRKTSPEHRQQADMNMVFGQVKERVF